MSEQSDIELNLEGALKAKVHTGTYLAMDRLDAAFFSGDSFHSEEGLRFVEAYLARWQREANAIREMLAKPLEIDDDE